MDDTNIMCPEFLAYLYNDDKANYLKVSKDFGYKEEIIVRLYNARANSHPEYRGSLSNDKFAGMNIPQSEIERFRKLKVFSPNSQDAITLFRIAAKAGKLPESWATNKNLHYILGRESAGGKVGILNYTLK